MMRRYILAIAPFLLAACTASGPQTAWFEKPSMHKPLSPAVEYVANSPDFRRTTNEAYGDAIAFVEHYGKTHRAGSWVVVMDLDQTVLNNIAYHMAMDHAGETFTPENWRAWTQEKAATLIPGAWSFINRVNGLGGHIAFVSNRRDYEQLATEENLAALGLERGRDFRVLISRASPLAGSDKESRFALVPKDLAVQGYPNARIIAYVGDVKGDAPRRLNGAKFFCIPQGGMYGENCIK